ncbi:MAG: heterodisulfide reductase-related iron-sulfur binding cluster [Chloroflexota bacterium]|nr:heterodisulfide reductase-related iron-sulfur binding cluster [Chloroflexota bacterium]
MQPAVPTREVYWNIQGIWIMYALLVVTMIVFGYGVYRYWRIIAIGKPEDRFDRPGDRLRAFLQHAVAQGRTLRQRYAGMSHWLFSWGFVILTIGTTVVMIHEDLGHVSPVFQIMQGDFYLWFQSLALDVFGLLAIVGVTMAIVRRRGVGGGRRDRLYRPGDPRTILDDAFILWSFLVILVTGFVLEGARIIATADPWAAWSPVGYATGLAMQGVGLNVDALLGLHRFGWWFHLVLALAWIAYLPYSKLRHIVASPANIYFRSFKPKGALSFVDIEKAFEQDPPSIGLGSLADLTWKDRLDVVACTECTRCEAACPASRTGKPLSPMLVVLDIRNQILKEGGPSPFSRMRRARGDDSDAAGNVTTTGASDDLAVAAGARPDTASANTALTTAPPDEAPLPSPIRLVGDVITDPVLWDCTTCRACMEACPVFIEHVPKIMDMRRYLVLVESRFEPELQRLFDNLEAAGNPWRFPRTDRAAWRDGADVPVPVLGEGVQIDEVDVLYWVGCAGAYDERNQRVARALAEVLGRAGVRFAILGTRETCCGDPARRAGNEYLWQMLAGENVATLNELGLGVPDGVAAGPANGAAAGSPAESTDGRTLVAPPPKTILASCPHCFNTLKDEYPQLGGRYRVRHHAEYLAELLGEGRLRPTEAISTSGPAGAGGVAYHDPCYLGRYQDIYDQPREILGAIPGVRVNEIRAGCRNKAMCCGAGGAKIWFEERRGTRVNHLRMDQVQAERPDQVAVACPFCMIMFEDATRAKGIFEELPILDISEFLARSLPPSTPG